MTVVDRFGVSMDTELLVAFDALIASRGYANRSEAIRDLVRDALTRERPSDEGSSVVATLTLVCTPQVNEAGRRLREELAKEDTLVAGVHAVPMGPDREMNVIVLRGQAGPVQHLADRIMGMRGISHGQLVMIPRTEST